MRDGRVTFRLEDAGHLELGGSDPQFRHLDHAWASTVHAFQGRTVDNVIAAMEAKHPNLTTQKSFYVEISRARDRAELVTDDAAELAPGSRPSPASASPRSTGSGKPPGTRRRWRPQPGVQAKDGPVAKPGMRPDPGAGSPEPPAKGREPPAPKLDRSRDAGLGL